VALSDRLNRLEGDYGPELREERYCTQAPTFLEVIRYPDSTEERLDEPAPPLCASCPYADDPNPPIRHIEVVRTVRAEGPVPSSPTKTRSCAHSPGPTPRAVSALTRCDYHIADP
jgi:hypothetical protein